MMVIDYWALTTHQAFIKHFHLKIIKLTPNKLNIYLYKNAYKWLR